MLHYAVISYANSHQVIANLGYNTISGQENPAAVKKILCIHYLQYILNKVGRKK